LTVMNIAQTSVKVMSVPTFNASFVSSVLFSSGLSLHYSDYMARTTSNTISLHNLGSFTFFFEQMGNGSGIDAVSYAMTNLGAALDA